MDHKLSITTKKNSSKFFYEENHSPSFRHLSVNLHENLSPGRHSNATMYLASEPASPLLPQSPESLWSCSPLSTPSHRPSLLYCCISSLRRDGDIYSIAALGDLVLTGSSSRRIHAWQPLDCHAKGYVNASSGEVRAMVAHGEILFTSHKDHKVRIWNMRRCSGNSFRPRKVTTLPNSSHFKSFCRLLTPQHKVMSKSISNPLHKDIISCMAYYHVEGILYTGSFDTTVKAWRVNEKKCVDSFIAHEGNVNDLVVNQQNGYLFTCSSDGTIKMWLRVYGENNHALIKVLTCHTHIVYALALSVLLSQETFLYSGSSDGSINYWERELSCRYTHRGILQGHRFAVLCLTTLENMVISGSEDSTIRIWTREIIGGGTHECLAVLEGHRGPVKCLALQKDRLAKSFLVYSASLDQTFKVWRVKVLPTDTKKSPFKDEDDDQEDDKNDNPVIKTNPVLSPSWVKKQLHCRSLHNY